MSTLVGALLLLCWLLMRVLLLVLAVMGTPHLMIPSNLDALGHAHPRIGIVAIAVRAGRDPIDFSASGCHYHPYRVEFQLGAA